MGDDSFLWVQNQVLAGRRQGARPYSQLGGPWATNLMRAPNNGRRGSEEGSHYAP